MPARRGTRSDSARRSKPPLEMIERVREVARRMLDLAALAVGRVQRAHIGQRIGERARRVGETVAAETNAVLRELGAERFGARCELSACLVVRRRAEALALRVAEDACEED